jgi:threonine dehydrogenase-like Zn-dependent dehydrogenase
MGIITEVGNAVKHFAVGDRVVVVSQQSRIQLNLTTLQPFTISCGSCFFCANEEYSLCDNSNPHSHISEETMGYGLGGLFGFTKLCGGYDGG